MKEIKFKAWDKKKKDFVFYPKGIQTTVMLDGSKAITIDDENVEFLLFTGFKDKNGKEVYKGDIVTFSIDDENGLYEIIFNEEYASFEAKCIKSNDIGIVGKNSCIFTGRIRAVIGNIYENPELLNG